MILKKFVKLGLILTSLPFLTACFGNTVNSFCEVYEVDSFYPAERVIIQDAIENQKEITLPPLKTKLANLQAHDTLDC